MKEWKLPVTNETMVQRMIQLLNNPDLAEQMCY